MRGRDVAPPLLKALLMSSIQARHFQLDYSAANAGVAAVAGIFVSCFDTYFIGPLKYPRSEHRDVR